MEVFADRCMYGCTAETVLCFFIGCGIVSCPIMSGGVICAVLHSDMPSFRMQEMAFQKLKGALLECGMRLCAGHTHASGRWMYDGWRTLEGVCGTGWGLAAVVKCVLLQDDDAKIVIFFETEKSAAACLSGCAPRCKGGYFFIQNVLSALSMRSMA